MLLLDLVVGCFVDCCSLLGLDVDAALYLLLSRKWCPPVVGGRCRRRPDVVGNDGGVRR